MENVMARDRSVHHSEQWIHSSRSNAALTTEPNTNRLPGTRMALIVSSTGEQTMYPIVARGYPITVSKNPAVNEPKVTVDLEHIPEEADQRNDQRPNSQKPRRVTDNKRRRRARTISTPRFCTSRKLESVSRCVSAQTEQSINDANACPEYIGDPGKFIVTSKSVDGRPRSRKELGSIDRFLAQFMTENLRILTSFLMLVILMFWLISIILDIEFTFAVFQTVMDYIWHFEWSYYQKPPPTNTEKYLQWLRKLFE